MTWIAPRVERAKTVKVADERAMLQSWLEYHRQTLLRKCSGLTAEQLTIASVEPSNLTLLGLVRHMTEVERAWFRRRAAGLDLDWVYCRPDSEDADFDEISASTAEADLATFREECAAADAVAAGLSLDATFVHPRDNAEISLRWVYVHMIEEYARHNGHADLIRERIDGVTGV